MYLNKKKRICIFCLYDKEGMVDRSALFTLNGIRKVVEDIIIVVNGGLKNIESLNGLASRIIVRENRGFDAAAYKQVITDESYWREITQYDELVLCNSSFFGPFIPFKDIFDEMDSHVCDFWGISSSELNMNTHIQSYFVVYRDNILRNSLLRDYFEVHIDESMTYQEICASFEHGLFWELVNAGYLFDAYIRNIRCDNYRNPYSSMVLDKLPIMKKKTLSCSTCKEEQLFSAINYAYTNYSYDISDIMEYSRRVYSKIIEKDQIMECRKVLAYEDIFQKVKVERDEVEKFIENNKEVYILGTGGTAYFIYSCFFFYINNSRLKGFVVSDEMKEECGAEYMRYKIFSLSEIENGASIIVAVSNENTNSLSEVLKSFNCLTLWGKEEKIF